MKTEHPRFRLIEGGGKSRRSRDGTELLTCNVCKTVTGTPTSAVIELNLGMKIKDGKAQGGTPALYCAHCLSRGTLTRLL